MSENLEFMDLLLKLYKEKADESKTKAFQDFHDKHKEIIEERELNFKKLETKPEPQRITELTELELPKPITDLNLTQIKEV